MPKFVSSTRFKPWFPVKLPMIIIYSTIQLLKVQADIYHAHVETALLACYIAAILRRKPFIIDTPDLTLSDPHVTRWPWLKGPVIRIIRHIVLSCAGYITASPFYIQELNRLYGAKEVTLIKNVPPFQRVPKSDRLRQYLGLNPDTRIALYQGGLQPNRSLDILVHAASFLETNIIIVMMGPAVKTTQNKLENLIACKGVVDRIKIIPPVPYEDLLTWTASADIGLTIFQPNYSRSIQFTLPNKLFEYMMAGLPVLSSQLDAVAEIIKTYDIGMLLPSVTPSDVVAAINAMLADTTSLTRMQKNALEAAKNEFYWEKESLRLIQLYQNILQRETQKIR
jgi:glycosyltransferase involved in cell wall biosynthesis